MQPWKAVPHALTPHAESRRLNPPKKLEERDWKDVEKIFEKNIDLLVINWNEHLQDPTLLTPLMEDKSYLNDAQLSAEELRIYNEIQKRVKTKIDPKKLGDINNPEAFIKHWFIEPTTTKISGLLKEKGLSGATKTDNPFWTS